MTQTMTYQDSQRKVVAKYDEAMRMLCSVVPIAHPLLIVRTLRLARQTGDNWRSWRLLGIIVVGGRLFFAPKRP